MKTVSKSEFIHTIEFGEGVQWAPVEFDGYLYILTGDGLIRCKI